jgi:peptide/nickel transport system permease protein
VAFNFPLVFGGLIVLALFSVVLFGPLWAPVNPYIAGQHIVPHYDYLKEEWISPPLSPSEEYPLGTDQWGNDIFSMLMYGARNTLIACAFITMVRVIVGSILGAIAGWHSGGLSDQIVMGVIGVITSVPLLISSMLMILALDIRRGLPVFIVALAAVGWTEIAQYIRGEFLVLRKMPYIEGARAVGTRNLAIAVRHILPNLLPHLLVITFLELGAVLTLLGELSFIGVFIGGGGRIALGDELTGIELVTRAQVPEWGAMLAEGYRWLRAKPFIVFPPAIAFFIAVVGLNAFGEGLRRLMEEYHVDTGFLLRKRMLVVIFGLSLATVFIINNTGPAPWFARVARAFDGESALAAVKDLSAMEGRGAGQAGGTQAAEYVVNRFKAYGLQPGWLHSDYVYPLETRLVRPLRQPVLELISPEGRSTRDFRHQIDFGYLVEGHAGSGQAENPLTFVGFPGTGKYPWESFEGLDLRDRIVLLIEGNAPPEFVTEALIRGARGVLWVTEEGRDEVRSQIQLADPNGLYLERPTIPVFRIRPAVLDELLETEGVTLDDLLMEGQTDQIGPGWFARGLRTVVHMSLSLDEPQTVEIPNLLGFLPGTDYDLAGDLVILFAHYDALGMDPDGTVYPGANHNASGVGVMLEIARLWQEQDLNPRRSVMFVAWGGGQLGSRDARQFLGNSRSFRHLPNLNSNRPLSPDVILEIDDVGSGGSTLVLHPGSSGRLAKTLGEIANGVDVDVRVADGRSASPGVLARPDRTAWLSLSWSNANVLPSQDTFERIKSERLQAVGEVVVELLTRIVRENSY